MVVLAPTGSGKTEVFLLPIVEAIATGISDNNRTQQRFVLLYPRVPLLKDQLSRVFSATYHARQHHHLQKPFIIGFQFSGVRANTDDTLNDRSIFTARDQNQNQMFQVVKTCPICQNGNLIYGKYNSDPRGVSRLKCSADSSHWWHVSIARNDHMECHPHVLVTTAETLDRIYLNPTKRYEDYLRNITGIGFDEVHMYHGLYGVHIYNLIRRIEDLCGRELTKIASSATVSNPASFAARLFYGNEARENDILVHNADEGVYKDLLQPSGLEVIYFLQSPETPEGEPSRTFSTLIQTEMVIGHALHSGEQRALTFMESLDGAGRLTKQLKDAENRGGLWRFRTLLSDIEFGGSPCQSTNPLGCSTIYAQGECWRGILGGFNCHGAIEGFREDPLSITQVSSQIKNDFRDGNTVIATSILEVGVDDDRIKTTIHYLPPRTVFSFIQRRGRAGRGSADPVAYTVMVLGNEPSDQFYFFRRNRLLRGKFELPLNSTNSRVHDMHTRLSDERNSMKGYIAALRHTPNGAWRWVWDKITTCSFLDGRYHNKFVSINDRSELQQKQWVQDWIKEEIDEFGGRLNLRLRLRVLQQQLPDMLSSAALAISTVESHLNGGASKPQVRSSLQALKSEVEDILWEFDESQDPELKSQLETISSKIYPMWDAIRQNNGTASLAEAQRLHDFFRVLNKLFADPRILFSPPDIIKITLQSLFYLHLGLSEAEEGPCSSRIPFFIPDAYFQVVRPVIVEKREILPANIQRLETTEESVTLLSNALVPYFTAYRYFGERLSTLDTEFIQRIPATADSVERIILRIADSEGIQRGDKYEANKVGVRPLRGDEQARGFVRMCRECFSLFDFDRVTPCHGRRPDVVKVMARSIVERGYSCTDSRPVTQRFGYLYEMEGQTTVFGSEVDYQVYFPKNDAWIPLGDVRKFEAFYEDSLYYAIPTRGFRWDLSDIIPALCNDDEIINRFAEEVTPYQPSKELTPEVLLHTAAHILHKSISTISGVNEQELEYFCDIENSCVAVWERFEGGQGLQKSCVISYAHALKNSIKSYWQQFSAPYILQNRLS